MKPTRVVVLLCTVLALLFAVRLVGRPDRPVHTLFAAAPAATAAP